MLSIHEPEAFCTLSATCASWVLCMTAGWRFFAADMLVVLNCIAEYLCVQFQRWHLQKVCLVSLEYNVRKKQFCCLQSAIVKGCGQDQHGIYREYIHNSFVHLVVSYADHGRHAVWFCAYAVSAATRLL
jgi:hypothetical protein